MSKIVATDNPKYVSLAQASQHSSLSVPTLRRWLAAGRLTPFRPNRRVLVDVAELDKVIRASASR